MLHLLVYDDVKDWRVCWLVNGDRGLDICAKRPTKMAPSRSDVQRWEAYTADLAAKSTPGCRRDRRGYIWRTEKEAASGKRAAMDAINVEPLADWEREAMAHGWTPPVGRQ